MLNYSDKTLEKKEKEIKAKYKPIKFKSDKIKIKKPEDIFNILFNNNHMAATIYADSDKSHCSNDRYRSYYDAYLLTLHYFPGTSFKDMYRLLRGYVIPSFEKYMKSPNRSYWSEYWGRETPFWTCGTIGKSRFSYKFKIKFK